MSPLRVRILRALTLVVAVACVALAARAVDWPATLHTLGRASTPLVLLATAANLSSLVLRAVCWWVFLRPVGAPSLTSAVRAMVLGSGLNNLLVANGGDAARAVLVARRTGLPLPTLLATVALERAFDALCYLLLLLAFALLPISEEMRRWRPLAAALVAALVVTLVALGRRATPAEHPGISGPPLSSIERVSRALRHFLTTTGHLTTTRRSAAALSLSLLGWGAQLWTYDLAARAVGAPLPLAGDVATLLAANAGVALRATPGSVGVFQVAYAATAARFGVPSEAAVAASILLQALQILPVTALAILLAPGLILRSRLARPVE